MYEYSYILGPIRDTWISHDPPYCFGGGFDFEYTKALLGTLFKLNLGPQPWARPNLAYDPSLD
jgi:hypothetical protein